MIFDVSLLYAYNPYESLLSYLVTDIRVSDEAVHEIPRHASSAADIKPLAVLIFSPRGFDVQ
jgi:hypothetical protein